MLVRIVKLSFSTENISSFEQLFEDTHREIRSFPGCSFLALHQDIENPNIFFTYSHWDSAMALEQYRQSDFFKNVWATTKRLFNNKPEAWSLNTIKKMN